VGTFSPREGRLRAFEALMKFYEITDFNQPISSIDALLEVFIYNKLDILKLIAGHNRQFGRYLRVAELMTIVDQFTDVAEVLEAVEVLSGHIKDPENLKRLPPGSSRLSKLIRISELLSK
jgi:hypothetical protein